jgi:hypothetical protein
MEVPEPTQPPTQWVPGLLMSGVKRPEREVDQLVPTSRDRGSALYKPFPPTPSLRSA